MKQTDEGEDWLYDIIMQNIDEESQKQLAAEQEFDRERARQLAWVKEFRRRFPPGQSGKRPKGAGNRLALAMEAMFEAEKETIMHILISKAKEGHAGALRLCADRLLPPRRARMVEFDLPTIDTAADAAKAIAAVMAACADGDLSMAEAGEVVKMIEAHVCLIEACDLEKRLSVLEQDQRP